MDESMHKTNHLSYQLGGKIQHREDHWKALGLEPLSVESEEKRETD